jgi:hypothetical protein
LVNCFISYRRPGLTESFTMADIKSSGYKPTTIENVGSNGTYGESVPPKKQSKMKANFRKYWWLHLTSFVLCTLLISLLL